MREAVKVDTGYTDALVFQSRLKRQDGIPPVAAGFDARYWMLDTGYWILDTGY